MAATRKKSDTRRETAAAAQSVKDLSLVREIERKTDRVFATLRKLALEQQQETPQVFLSLREAARRFQVPISAMAEVYRRLREEGLLSSIRASHTVLRGRGTSRTLTFHGIIGMPLSVARLMTLRDYRQCFIETGAALRARGFLVEPLYFQERETDPESLIQRLKQEKVDAAVCLLPDGAGRETPARLRDLGIEFIGINIGEVSGPPARYEIRRGRALGAIFRTWAQQRSLDRVTIVRTHGDRPVMR